ncbi:tyrosine-type recombinase/integrase [Nocardioides sp. QY071]|uniref:tyrosine-type recombinase/integrase n=1 Tax=Nocardioides sp. QY071 TaxID=3044187 RepID=UPI00249CDEFC|nr:tyrosine-type recombinase/integrase [Nocardioides sp. QY071]WGY03715.1 tyrosine-type recombinase/integrase [Nocardioides sp. QY071]
MRPSELEAFVPSWTIHLRAERKTAGTIKTYLDGVRPYLAWCVEQEAEPLARGSLQAWTAELLDAGRSPSTAKTRMQAVRHFTRWLAEEGEIDGNPFDRMRPPKVDMPVVPVLSDDQVSAMLKACQPVRAEDRTGLPSLRHRRDEAIIRLMHETGLRASECLNLELPDVDLVKGLAIVRRGKGGKGRTVPFGAQTAKALDRYLRVRRLHRLADGPRLWLGDRGKELAYGGLYWALGERAKQAGIDGFHPHQLRHTSVDRWLAKGGSETGAMAMHGWSSPEMLQRYGKANREQRAIDEARKLNLGDL